MAEFLQLAKLYDPVKHGIAGWYMSEKLDGMRAYWDGGWTRGKKCNTIPFANTAKDNRYVEERISTGLWSRYAKPIYAPDWFLDQLPEIPLDGELYIDRGKFQDLISIVKQLNPDERWQKVKYMIFDCPGDNNMYAPRRINNPQFSLQFPDLRGSIYRNTPEYFYRVIDFLNNSINLSENICIASQERLPINTLEAVKLIEKRLEYVTNLNGEGLMLRKPESVWEPKRTDTLLKIKKLLDSEACVTGYKWGKGKYEKLLGSIIVLWQNKVFDLSGFSDEERALYPSEDDPMCPGSIAFERTISPKFPRGSMLTFRYTEVSKDGIPLKARYLRKA